MGFPCHMYHPEQGVKEFRTREHLETALESDDRWRDHPYSVAEQKKLGVEDPKELKVGGRIANSVDDVSVEDEDIEDLTGEDDEEAGEEEGDTNNEDVRRIKPAPKAKAKARKKHSRL